MADFGEKTDARFPFRFGRCYLPDKRVEMPYERLADPPSSGIRRGLYAGEYSVGNRCLIEIRHASTPAPTEGLRPTRVPTCCGWPRARSAADWDKSCVSPGREPGRSRREAFRAHAATSATADHERSVLAPLRAPDVSADVRGTVRPRP